MKAYPFKRASYIFILFLILFQLSCDKENVTSDLIINELTAEQKNEILTSINEVRSTGCNCGVDVMQAVEPLTWNEKLEIAATKHSIDMNENNFFDHTNKQGISAGIRIENEDYFWTSYGENIALGPATVESVMNLWLSSEGHCKNIMNEHFKDVGVGLAGSYWTMDLGVQ